MAKLDFERLSGRILDLEESWQQESKFKRSRKAEIKIDSSLPFLEGIHQMSATIYAMKTRRNIMVDALNPEMPNSGTEALTASQQRFEQAVDSAYRQFYSGLDSRGPAPVSLLSYASGSLSGTDRERFERELEVKGGMSSVVATMKAARPVEANAPLEAQLSFTITKNLLSLIQKNPSATPSDILRSFSQSSHEAVIRSKNVVDLDQVQDFIDKGDDDQLHKLGKDLTGTNKALYYGCLGKLEDAQTHWSSLEDKNTDLTATLQLALSDTKAQDASSPLSSLTAKLSDSPRETSSLLNILLDFAQSRHRS